jgi:mRNA-degrading endonuclease RelE of RelBE toxin-antitoxin system
VISRTTANFRQQLAQLPKPVQRLARTAYQKFKQNPYHPSLHFKRVHPLKPLYSVRINLDYRAVGIQEENEMVWFWIGTHAKYDKVLSQL